MSWPKWSGKNNLCPGISAAEADWVIDKRGNLRVLNARRPTHDGAANSNPHAAEQTDGDRTPPGVRQAPSRCSRYIVGKTYPGSLAPPNPNPERQPSAPIDRCHPQIPRAKALHNPNRASNITRYHQPDSGQRTALSSAFSYGKDHRPVKSPPFSLSDLHRLNIVPPMTVVAEAPTLAPPRDQLIAASGLQTENSI